MSTKTTKGTPAPTKDATTLELTSCYAAESITVPIKHPATGADTTMYVVIESVYSQAARRSTLKATHFTLQDGEVKADAGIDDSILEQLVSVTRDWGGFVVGGELLPCIPD